jgi:DNA gyrase subunit A
VSTGQGRGGRGKSATAVKDEDFVEKLFVANTHDTLLCFSSRGQLYWLKVYQLPMAGRASRGKPIVNLLPFEAEYTICSRSAIRGGPLWLHGHATGTAEDRVVLARARRASSRVGLIRATSSRRRDHRWRDDML